jgi:ubiquinone/menaquinone biosynthesis C-methylase UbiE
LTNSRELGCQTNTEVIDYFVSLTDRFVIDAGCGNLGFSRQLVEQGARVLAIDPDSVQAGLNREAEPIDDLEFVETGADRLPVESDSADGVFFIYSLHHIPANIYTEVFQEVIRVLKPDGFLFVIEPLNCPFNEVMKLFHDEDREREAAQRAVFELAAPAFDSLQVVTYHNWAKYDSWDDFASQIAGRSFNSLYSESDVRRPEVKESFERLGGPEHRFRSPKQAMFLKGLKS